MANFIVVYSTRNNKPYESPAWRVVADDYATLEAAHNVFEYWKQKAQTEDNTEDWPIYGKITQVAIFVDHGRDTFTTKPRYYADYRDKSGWELSDQVSNFVNALNSDFTVNKSK